MVFFSVILQARRSFMASGLYLDRNDVLTVVIDQIDFHDMKRKWGKDEMIHENNVKKMKYFMFFVYKS